MAVDAETLNWLHEIAAEVVEHPLRASGLDTQMAWRTDVEFDLTVEMPFASTDETTEVVLPTFDMKPRLLKHARVSTTYRKGKKKEVRYQIIPFSRWNRRADGSWRSGHVSGEDQETKYILSSMADPAQIERMLPQQRAELRRVLKMRGMWPDLKTGKNIRAAVYPWEVAAAARLATDGSRYYRQWYKGGPTPEGGPSGQNAIARTPLQRGQGITFRTVTDQPKQAAAWWYPSRRVKLHRRAAQNVALTREAETLLRDLGLIS